MGYFYGFKNKETGLFMRTYQTIRWKTKTACFRNIGQAQRALNIHFNNNLSLINEWCITTIIETED